MTTMLMDSPRRTHEFKSSFAPHIGEQKITGTGRLSHFNQKINEEAISLTSCYEKRMRARERMREAAKAANQHWWETTA